MAELSATTHKLKDGSHVTIRSAVESDAEKLLNCLKECITDGTGLVREPDEFNRTEEEQRNSIRDFSEGPCDMLLVVESERKLIASLDFRAAKRKRLAHTGDFGMSVLKAWRSKGIGSALLDTLIEWARSNPAVEKINLRVIASNEAAIGLYYKFGFKEEGRSIREIKYSDRTYEDELLMAKFV